jgi:hypothetical protein
VKNIRARIENVLNQNQQIITDYGDIEHVLSPYITDRGFLREFRSTGDAIGLVTCIQKIKKDYYSYCIFRKSLFMFNKGLNDSNYKKILNCQFRNIINSQNFAWSDSSLNNTILKTEDTFKAIKCLFDNINKATEQLLKPYINILYFVNNYPCKDEKANPDLGKMIQNLKSEIPAFVIKGLPISQWRNISDHKTYEYKNNKIICLYGNNNDKKKVLYSINSLIFISNKITKIYNAIYTAFNLFFYNNVKLFSTKALNFREDIWLDSFKISIGALNFLIANYKNNNVFAIKIKDIENISGTCKEKQLVRAIHCSQFVVNIWPFVKKDIRIIYCDSFGTTKVIFFFKHTDINCIVKHKMPLYQIAEKMTFEFLSEDLK